MDEGDPEDLRRNLARLLWRSKLASGLTPEDRKSNWAETRRDYMAQASKVLRLMEQESVSIALTGAKASDEAGEDEAGEFGEDETGEAAEA